MNPVSTSYLASEHGSAVGAATIGWSVFQGFVPINPMIIPIQIGLFIVLILILIYGFGVSSGQAALGAWVLDGLFCSAVMYGLVSFALFGLGKTYERI